jgi:hypothetical protein
MLRRMLSDRTGSIVAALPRFAALCRALPAVSQGLTCTNDGHSSFPGPKSQVDMLGRLARTRVLCKNKVVSNGRFRLDIVSTDSC